MKKINFNVPPVVGDELKYIEDAVKTGKICGDGKYTRLCSEWLEQKTKASAGLLTTSCTHATELAAILCGIREGDEVIMPSYTFVSTADAFVLRGAKAVFVDIRPDTMNIDENLIEAAITEKTKAIVPVHYAGVACEMDKIMELAEKYNLYVVEDAAQGMMASYKGKALGSIGDMGCYSFHETKNYSMGEGGAILLRDGRYKEAAEIIREKGTNRSKFFRGEIDKYTWVEAGSSYLPSELNAAYLYAQLEIADAINDDRLKSWTMYMEALTPLRDRGFIQLPTIPDDCQHNAHIFYIKVKNIEQRTELIRFLKERGIGSAFHYVPLHSAPAGKVQGTFCGIDQYTTRESEQLLRLPMFYNLPEEVLFHINSVLEKFFYKM